MNEKGKPNGVCKPWEAPVLRPPTKVPPLKPPPQPYASTAAILKTMAVQLLDLTGQIGELIRVLREGKQTPGAQGPSPTHRAKGASRTSQTASDAPKPRTRQRRGSHPVRG